MSYYQIIRVNLDIVIQNFQNYSNSINYISNANVTRIYKVNKYEDYNSESFHLGPTMHQKIAKEFISNPNTRRQLKIFSCEQRQSKCTLIICFTGQLKIYPYGISTMNQENQTAIR